MERGGHIVVVFVGVVVVVGRQLEAGSEEAGGCVVSVEVGNSGLAGWLDKRRFRMRLRWNGPVEIERLATTTSGRGAQTGLSDVRS